MFHTALALRYGCPQTTLPLGWQTYTYKNLMTGMLRTHWIIRSTGRRWPAARPKSLLEVESSRSPLHAVQKPGLTGLSLSKSEKFNAFLTLDMS